MIKKRQKNTSNSEWESKNSSLPNLNFEDIKNKFINSNKFSDVIDLYWFLFSDNTEQRDFAIQSIQKKMSATKHMKLINYDKQFRAKTSFNWGYNWKEQELDFLDQLVEEEVMIDLLGITTFHPNGYLREKALKKLAKINNHKVIPYMIIRLNDWVGVISKIAIDYLNDMVREDNIVSCIGYFDMFQHIENYQRSSGIFLLHKIEGMIEEHDNLEKLLSNINRYSDFVKIIIYRKAANGMYDNPSDFIQLVLKERLGYVQGKVLPEYIDKMESDMFIDTYEVLKKSRSYKVREATFIKFLLVIDDIKFEDVAWGLLDGSKAVRETARFYSKKYGFDDFRSFYYDEMDKYRVNAVTGLCEVANIEDYKYLYAELDQHKITLTRKIMKTLSELNFKMFLEELYDRLNDKRLGISSEARRILIENKNEVEYDRIFEIYEKAKSDSVVKNAVMVLLGAPKWIRLRYILLFNESNNKEILTLTNNARQHWIDTFNCAYTEPTKSEKDKIEEAFYHTKMKLTENQRLWFAKLLNI